MFLVKGEGGPLENKNGKDSCLINSCRSCTFTRNAWRLSVAVLSPGFHQPAKGREELPRQPGLPGRPRFEGPHLLQSHLV